jgi:hypothetical protein
MFTCARYGPAMAKSPSKDADPLERWRHFEEKYAEQVTPYISAEPDPLDKDQMVELVALREKADRWRDRYFKAHHDA